MLDKLKNNLRNSGYYIVNYSNLLSIGVSRSTPTNSDIPDLKVISFDCIIEENDGIKIEYNIANISDEVVFTSVSKAESWIKKQFPI